MTVLEIDTTLADENKALRAELAAFHSTCKEMISQLCALRAASPHTFPPGAVWCWKVCGSLTRATCGEWVVGVEKVSWGFRWLVWFQDTQVACGLRRTLLGAQRAGVRAAGRMWGLERGEEVKS